MILSHEWRKCGKLDLPESHLHDISCLIIELEETNEFHGIPKYKMAMEGWHPDLMNIHFVIVDYFQTLKKN